MSSFKYMIIGLAQSSGMPPEDGGKGMAVSEPGDYSKGYKVVQGGWQPNGIWVGIFDTEKEVDDWMKSTPGQSWLSKIKDVVQLKLKT